YKCPKIRKVPPCDRCFGVEHLRYASPRTPMESTPAGHASPRRSGGAPSSRKGAVAGSAEGQETQRPAICASGDCPIALTIGSQPSSHLRAGGALLSAGPVSAFGAF